MKRRKALKNMSLSAGAFVATPSVLLLLQSCTKEQPWIPTFFSKEEGIFIKSLVETFLPAFDNLPGALDVNVHIFIDKYMKEVMPVKEKVVYRILLKTSIKNILAQSGEEQVSSVKKNAYLLFLEKHLNKSKEEHKKINEEVWKYPLEATGDGLALPDNLQIYRFLTFLQEKILWSYKISKKVGTEVLAYNPVPGNQQGCVDLQQTTNGRAWYL